jgi:hypothetical protein
MSIAPSDADTDAAPPSIYVKDLIDVLQTEDTITPQDKSQGSILSGHPSVTGSMHSHKTHPPPAYVPTPRQPPPRKQKDPVKVSSTSNVLANLFKDVTKSFGK